ncbi:MAG: hypothetical protein NUV34_11815, partial [Sulfuricaulis sp.]|nr:hypothetical protein [Sulfuricaulis sp.]
MEHALRVRLEKLMAGGSASQNIVIPAKAGIQVLNGVARLARDLNSYLWVADPRQVTFSCAHKRKSPKR